MSGEGNLLLAIDFGLKRIGIASANTLTGTATPVSTLEMRGDLPWEEIDRLMADWRPSVVVVGFPHADSTTEIGRAIARFVKALRARYPTRIETVDETHTSTAAAAQLKAGRELGLHPKRLGKGRIDRHAACLIAEQWMREVRR